MVNTFPERNIKHKCAEYAYRCITDISGEEPAVQTDYRSEVMSTGTRIYSTGLMQTLTFYCSKIKEGKPHFEKLSLHVTKWILRSDKLGNEMATLQLLEFLLNQPDDKMMYFTQEAMEVTQWLKRFADAKLEKKTGT